MDPRKLARKETSHQPLVAQLFLELPAPLVELIVDALIHKMRNRKGSVRERTDQIAKCSGSPLETHLPYDGWAELCLTHMNFHVALKDYTTEHMRRHIVYLHRNYQMMVGLNAFSLLRGSYMWEKAKRDPNNPVLQSWNPGPYMSYARGRGSQSTDRKKALTEKRVWKNPELTNIGQKRLVRKYARELYGGAPL